MPGAGQGYRRKKRSPLFAPLSFIIICAALVFGMSVFFRVSNIEVTGNSLYSSQEIIDASGIENGDNLFFINRFSAVSRIFTKLPYVSEATISRHLPNRIVISVTESQAAAYLTTDDGAWAVDSSGKVLSKVEDTAGLIRVDGLTPIAPTVGQTIAAGGADAPKVTYLTEILGQMSSLGMTGDVTEIDMSNVGNPTFQYLGRFTVKLGADSDVDYKFQLLLSAVAKLEPGDSGTLDLSIDKRAHLTYD